MSIIVGTWLVASAIFLFSTPHNLRNFSSIVVWCSIAVAVIGGCMISGTSGPRRGDEADLYLAANKLNPDIARHDQKDRDDGASLGFLIFIAGIISGGLGYGLYSLV
jgi:hypothetical protein